MLSFRVSSLLICILNLNSMIGQKEDICLFLKPDGKYEGIGLYRKYSYISTKVGYESFPLMYNSKGVELEFRLKPGYEIEWVQGNNWSHSPSVAQKFDILSVAEEGWEASECEIQKTNYSAFNCTNELQETFSFVKDSSIDIQMNADTIVFRPYANDVKIETFYTLIINRKHRQKIYFYCHWFGEPVKFLLSCDEGLGTCPNIEWLDQLDDSMYTHLDAIMDLDIGKAEDEKVFLLWFNMNGKPGYCITIEWRNLSNSCLTFETLTPAFPECFNTITTSTKTTEPISSKDRVLILVFIGELVLMGILVLAIIAVMNERRRRAIEGTKNSVTVKSYHSSEDGQNSSVD